MGDDFSNIKGFTGVKCETCNNLATENFQITLKCNNCHPPHIETFNVTNLDYKYNKCPSCNKELLETKKEKYYNCDICELNSLKNPNKFNKEIIATDIFKLLGLNTSLYFTK